MISLKLITAEVNLSPSIAFAIYVCVCMHVPVYASWNAMPFRVAPLYSGLQRGSSVLRCALEREKQREKPRGSREDCTGSIWARTKYKYEFARARDCERTRASCSSANVIIISERRNQVLTRDVSNCKNLEGVNISCVAEHLFIDCQ